MYLFLKLLHVLAAVAFIGNVVAGMFWYGFAVRTNDAVIVRHAIEGLNRSDRLFTFYGGIVLFLSGAALTWVGGYPLWQTLWIWTGFGMFLGAGAVFHAFGAPIRKQLLEMAQAGPLVPAACASLTARYCVVLSATIMMLLVATAAMVFKRP